MSSSEQPTEPGVQRAQPPAARSASSDAWTEPLRLIGGLLAVTAGLVALVVIAWVALAQVSDSQSTVSIATSAFGVIGTVIGAYFGVKVGSDGTQKAIAGLRDESAKAQAFAMHMDPAKAEEAISTARRLTAGSP